MVANLNRCLRAGWRFSHGEEAVFKVSASLFNRCKATLTRPVESQELF